MHLLLSLAALQLAACAREDASTVLHAGPPMCCCNPEHRRKTKCFKAEGETLLTDERGQLWEQLPLEEQVTTKFVCSVSDRTYNMQVLSGAVIQESPESMLQAPAVNEVGYTRAQSLEEPLNLQEEPIYETKRFACHRKGRGPTTTDVFCRQGPCPGQTVEAPKCPEDDSYLYKEADGHGVCIEEEDLIGVPSAVTEATHRRGRCPGVMFNTGCQCKSCK